MNILRYCLILSIASLSAGLVRADDWTGQVVIPKRSDVKFGRTAEDGKQVYFGELKSLDYKVRGDKGGFLLVYEQGKEGWADKEQMVRIDDAVQFFRDRIAIEPKDVGHWIRRAWAQQLKGELDKAIKDYDEAIRLGPQAAIYINRGSAFCEKKDFDRAIKDYDEAIRLDPKKPQAFNARGNAWLDKKDYDRAAKDYDEAIKLEPKYDDAHFGKAVALMLMRRPEAARGFETVLDIQGVKGDLAPYAILMGHFAARQTNDEARAQRFLKDAAGNLADAWPNPVVKFLRGEIDEPALLKLAADDEKRTDFHCYLGLDCALKGRKDDAITHLRWVKEHGNPGFTEYKIAVAELERLEKPGK